MTLKDERISGAMADKHAPKYADGPCSKAVERGYGGSCLECPFPRCLEDEGVVGEMRRAENAERDREVIERRQRKERITKIAREMGLDRKTVRDIIKNWM
jgi:hypothetical protein